MAEPLASRLRATWRSQAESGFLLGDPEAAVETRVAPDPATGVTFRFRWLPHREVRADTEELARRGILDASVDPASLFRDPRDPAGRYCFLCPSNLQAVFPAETLLPIAAGGSTWVAGANFAWLAANHFTVMTADHIDQAYERSLLDTMLDLHRETDGDFRVLYNGGHAGASIPWHRHLHLATEELPIERLRPGTEPEYPLPLRRFDVSETGPEPIDRAITTWVRADPRRHRANLLVAGPSQAPVAFVLERDVRRAAAPGKGLMGGFEAAGDFAYSEARSRTDFERADLATARRLLSEIRPPAPE